MNSRKLKTVHILLCVLLFAGAFSGQAQSKYFKAMSKVETEKEANQLIENHPKWKVSVVELAAEDSLKRPALYYMSKETGIYGMGGEGKAYKVLEEKRKLLLVEFEAIEPKRKKKYDY